MATRQVMLSILSDQPFPLFLLVRRLSFGLTGAAACSIFVSTLSFSSDDSNVSEDSEVDDAKEEEEENEAVGVGD